MDIDAAEAASRLGVDRRTLYAYVSRGLIRSAPAPGDPRRRLYAAADVARLVAGKGRGRAPAKVAEATLDFGLPVMDTAISQIAGGRLFYRGVDACRLAERATLEAAATLLWGCAEADPFAGPPDTVDASAPAAAHPLDRALATLAREGVAAEASWGRGADALGRRAAALMRRLVGAVAGEAAADGGAPAHERLAAAWRLGPAAADLVRRALVLLADHELNASTFTVRCVVSTGASLAAGLIGGLAALSGPLHGGASARAAALLAELEREGDLAAAVAARLGRGDRLPGFGHPLYPAGDPRARALLGALPANLWREAVLDAVARAGGPPPNIDFALVALARALNLPADAPLALFVAGRSAGWIAHALEQRAAGRLIRPRARYVGAPPPEE